MTFNTFEGHKIFVTSFYKGSLFSDGSNYMTFKWLSYRWVICLLHLYSLLLYFSFCNSASFFVYLFDLVWLDAMDLEHDTSVLTHIWLCNYVAISQKKLLNGQVSDFKISIWTFSIFYFLLFFFFCLLAISETSWKKFCIKNNH